MTVTEKEEKGNSSNMKIVEIKKENVEEDVNLCLFEFAKNSDSNDHQQLQIGASNSQNHIKEPPINEEKEDGEESEKSNEEDLDLGQDPLTATEEIVTKYHDFIEFVYQIVKEEPEEVILQWQKWFEILKRGRLLVKALNRSLKVVAIEMDFMKEIEEFKKEYALRKTHIPVLLARLRDINSGIETSPHFRVVSDVKKREEVLPICLDELKWSKQELTDILDVIQILKKIELEDAVDGELESKSEDDDEDDEETETD